MPPGPRRAEGHRAQLGTGTAASPPPGHPSVTSLARSELDGSQPGPSLRPRSPRGSAGCGHAAQRGDAALPQGHGSCGDGSPAPTPHTPLLHQRSTGGGEGGGFYGKAPALGECERSRGLPPAASAARREISAWFHHPPPPRRRSSCSVSGHPPTLQGRAAGLRPPPSPTSPPQPPACVRSGPSCATCAPRVHGSSWQSRVLSFGLSTAACRTRGGGALQSPQSPPPDAFLHAPNPLVTSPGLSVAAARLTRSVPPPRPPAQELPLLAAQSPHSAVPLPHIPLQPHSFPFSGLQAEVPLFPYSELPPPRALSGHRGGPQPVRPPPTMWELCPESHRPGSAMGN